MAGSSVHKGSIGVLLGVKRFNPLLVGVVFQDHRVLELNSGIRNKGKVRGGFLSASIRGDEDSSLGVEHGGGDFVKSADLDALGAWDTVPSSEERIPLENVGVSIFVLVAIESPETAINT